MMSEIANFPEDPVDPFRKLLAENGGKLTKKQVADLMNKVADGRISAMQLGSLLQLAPSICNPIASFLQSVPKLSEDISNDHNAAIAANQHIYDEHVSALRTLMDKCDTDDGRVKLAIEFTAAAKLAHDGIAKINKSTAKSREGLSTNVKFAIGGLITFGLAVARLAR